MSDHQPPSWNGPDAPVPPQFPPPPSSVSQQPGKRRPMGVWIVVAVAAVLAIGGGVTAATMLNSSEPLPPAEQVTLEPVGTPGTDPFLASVSIAEVTAFPDSVQAVASATAASMSTDAATGTLSVSGTTDNVFGGRQSADAELYGGSGELADCDVQGLAEFLAENPEKAKAWADVRDIDPAQIAEYLKTLTPVVLLHDTLVTNYGFSNGVAVPYQAVLQAGTGVLVDWTGQPVVRCACGNPLSAPKPTNLSSAELLGTRWDEYDPSRTVVVSGGPVAAGFVLVDVLTGQSYTRPVGFAAPVAATTASPTPAPAAATSGPECAFDANGYGASWVESDSASAGLTCIAMIQKWREYEEYEASGGETQGKLVIGNLPDGSSCFQYLWPPSDWGRANDDGSIGGCTMADGRRFIVWRGAVGQHLTQDGRDAGASGLPVATAAPAPAQSEPEPVAEPTECIGEPWSFVNGGWLDINASDMSCQEMPARWDAFLVDRSMVAESANGWNCHPPSAGDYGGCFNQGLGLAFSVFPLSDRVPGQEGGGADSPVPTGDLGLSVAITRPACDGMGIVVLFSATTPGSYEAEVQQALNDHPGSSYFRTDQTCSSLNQSYEGNPIYTVYKTAGYDLGGLCAAASSLGGYARWLNNTSAPNTDPCS